MKKSFKYSDRRGLPGGPNEQSSYREGFVVSQRGQWDYPGMDTLVPTPTGDITMQGVPYPVYGQDETGYGQMMYPGADYVFPGNFVYETPMAQKGKELKSQTTAPIRVDSDEYTSNPIKSDYVSFEEKDNPYYSGVKWDPKIKRLIAQFEPVDITAKATGWGRDVIDYRKKKPMEKFVQSKMQDYIRSQGQFGKNLGLSMENFPEQVMQNYMDEYNYNLNSYAAERIAKQKGYGLKRRGDWVDKLTPREQEIFAGSKYGTLLQPDILARAQAGARGLVNTLLPGQPISYDISGLTEREKKEAKESPFTAFEMFAPLDLPGIAIANYAKNRNLSTGSDYAELPSMFPGERMANVNDLDVLAANPLTYVDAAQVMTALPKLIKSAPELYSAGKMLGSQALTSAGTGLLRAAMTPTARQIPSGRMMSGFNPEMAANIFQNAFVNLRDDVIDSPLFNSFLQTRTGKDMILNYMENLGDPSRQAELLALADKPQFQKLMNNPIIQDIAKYNSTLGNANVKNLVNQIKDKMAFDTILKNADVVERSFVGPNDQIITGKFPAALDAQGLNRFETVNSILSWGESSIRGKLDSIASSYNKGVLDDAQIQVILNNKNITGKELVDILSRTPRDGDQRTLLSLDKTPQYTIYGTPQEAPTFSEIGSLNEEPIKTFQASHNQDRILREFLRRNDVIPQFDPNVKMPPITHYDRLGNPVYQGIGSLNNQNIRSLAGSARPQELLPYLVADPTKNPFANGRMVQQRIMNALANYKSKPSGFTATGSYNTSYNSWLPQLDVFFKYMDFDPNKPINLVENAAKVGDVNDPGLRSAIEFWKYEPMNNMGYLSRLVTNPIPGLAKSAFSEREMSQFLNARIDKLIREGTLPVNIARPYYSSRDATVQLPQFVARKFQVGGMANDESNTPFMGMLPQTGIDFTTIPDDVLAIMIANNR